MLRARFHAAWNQWLWNGAVAASSRMRGLHADLERLLGTGRAPQLTEIDRIIEGASHPVERPSYGVAGFF
ncbi:MAG: hypothetical protein NVV68_05125 [Dokdonella sp.]|nr:hypothetical protein [Dokdonella sp.]